MELRNPNVLIAGYDERGNPLEIVRQLDGSFINAYSEVVISADSYAGRTYQSWFDQARCNCAHSLITIEEVKTDSPVGFDGDVVYSDHRELIGTCSACGKKFSEEEMLNNPAMLGLLMEKYQPETVEDR